MEVGTTPRIRIGQRNGRGEDAGGDTGVPPVGETERETGGEALTRGVHMSAAEGEREAASRGPLASESGRR